MQHSKTLGAGRHPETDVHRASFLPPLAPPENVESSNARRTGRVSFRQGPEDDGRGPGAAGGKGREPHSPKATIEAIVFAAALVVSAALGYVMGNQL